ncbi:MAG: hypothetical protein IJX35_03985, partial [Candidatus Methanomethylophilaceae archaeon]|nr:hypothetical protein [Candidatus Methanomethylophilaceae archaeon]
GTLPTFTVTTDSFSGVTLYTKRVASSADADYPFITKAYINGVIKDGNVTASNSKPTVDLSQGTITVAEGEELLIKDDAIFTATGTIVIEGKLTVMKETSPLTTFVGAHYQVTPSAAADTVGYYTTVKDAMANIETADEKTVKIIVGTLVDNVTVKVGQTVDITATGIDKDAVFTAEDDSIVTLRINADTTSFEGMIIIAGDANCTGTPAGYASLKTGADGTKTYSGFLVAVLNASAGDVINIGTASVGTTSDRESLAIPAGVKVVVTTMLTIEGNLTIPATAELVGGTIVVNGESSTKPATIDVAGKLDLSAGALAGTNNKVTSSGEVIVQGLGDNMSGAYYVNDDGKYVLTGVANAIQKASTVTIIGTYTDMTDITLDKANIVIAENAKVTLGKVTLVQKKITANGDLTATITAKCGSDETTGAVSDATLEVVKSSAIIESTKVTSAAGVTTYTFKIDKIDGEMKVTQGTVTTSAVISSIAAGSKFTVASGATFAVVNNVTI